MTTPAYRFQDIQRALVEDGAIFIARRASWPPNHFLDFDGFKLWRFNGLRDASLTLEDMSAHDWLVSSASAFLPADEDVLHLSPARRAIGWLSERLA